MLTHEQKVQEKYNTLFRSENRFRKGNAYPIHKRLDFKGQKWNDIYDWLIDNVEFRAGDKVLDAGCGVGYGSLLMATEKGVHVDGISLSESEVAQAKTNCAASNLDNRVSFQVLSYDEVSANQYDVIVAIESVKHSANLDKSLRNLQEALKPGGKLVIIEDLYQQDELNNDAQRLQADYKLIDLFRAKDYYRILEEESCKIHDLNEYVLPKVMWKIRAKLTISDFINKLSGKRTNDITSILRGGYYLDRLYANGLMKYMAIVYTNL